MPAIRIEANFQKQEIQIPKKGFEFVAINNVIFGSVRNKTEVQFGFPPHWDESGHIVPGDLVTVTEEGIEVASGVWVKLVS